MTEPLTPPELGAGRPRDAAAALREFASRTHDAGAIAAALWRLRVAILVGVGIGLRVAQYLADRPYWLDEMSLAENLQVRSLPALFSGLSGGQLAPPGFLAAAWAAGRALGGGPFAFRLFPLLCGIGSLFLFRKVAAGCLRGRDVWVAVALFVVSDDLIYFASELKPYETDVAAGLAGTLLALRLTSRPLTARRATWAVAVGAVAVWFSFPSAIVLAGVGLTLLVAAIARGDGRGAGLLATVALAWAASFAAAYAVALGELADRGQMWAFWRFAFPPLPPSTIGEACWPLRRGLYLFANPLSFHTPLPSRWEASAAAALALAGLVSMGRRDAFRLGMIGAPAILALLAAFGRFYPFHGRLVLFLVPALLLLIAEGAGRVGDLAGGGWARAALLGLILLFPGLQAGFHLLEPRRHRDFNPRGDRRPAALDPAIFPF